MLLSRSRVQKGPRRQFGADVLGAEMRWRPPNGGRQQATLGGGSQVVVAVSGGGTRLAHPSAGLQN